MKGAATFTMVVKTRNPVLKLPIATIHSVEDGV